MNEQILNEEEVKQIDPRLSEFENRLITIVADIENFKDFVKVLSNKEEVVKYCGVYKKARILSNIINIIKTDRLYPVKNKDEINREITKTDPKLLKKINKIKNIPDLNELKTLDYISNKVTEYGTSDEKGKEKILEELNKNSKSIIEQLKNFNDKKLIRKLAKPLHFIASIKIKEIPYLKKYMDEVKLWSKIKQKLNYFSQRMYWMIHGRYGPYKGLLTDFNDKEIYNEILKSDILRNMWTYQHQRTYLANLLRMIKKGMEEADWKDFRTFYLNLSKERKKIGVDYGNKMISDVMKYIKEKWHEYPKEWDEQMSKVLTKIDSFEYQEKIIEQASKKLEEILSNRLTVLEKERNVVISKLNKLVHNKITEINELTKNKIPNTYIEIMEQEIKKLEAKRKQTIRFINSELKYLYILLGNVLDKAEPLIDRTYCEDKTPVIFNILGTEQRFIKDVRASTIKASKSFNEFNFVRALYDLNGIHKCTQSRNLYTKYITNIPKDYLKNLQSVIVGLNDLTKRIDKIYARIFQKVGFINLKLEEPTLNTLRPKTAGV